MFCQLIGPWLSCGPQVLRRRPQLRLNLLRCKGRDEKAFRFVDALPTASLLAPAAEQKIPPARLVCLALCLVQ